MILGYSMYNCIIVIILHSYSYIIYSMYMLIILSCMVIDRGRFVFLNIRGLGHRFGGYDPKKVTREKILC